MVDLSIGWVYRYRIVNNVNITSGVVAQQINSNYILRFTIKERTIWVGTMVL